MSTASRVLACVGAGGVGKTTISAALGVAAAAQGHKTLVMTIDPARRLASAMGVEAVGNVPHEIPAPDLAQYGVRLRAPLWAMMPDVKTTFDTLVERLAPDAQERRRIFSNRIYQQFSTVLAGAQEYAAVETLHRVYTSGEYACIVLDTPPAQSVAQFLSAPERIAGFLSNDAFRWLLAPASPSARLSAKLFDVSTALLLNTLGKLTGAETLRAIAEFLSAFQVLYKGIEERAQKVGGLLRSRDVEFVLVTAASPGQGEIATRFARELNEAGVTLRSTVVNRMRPSPFDAAGEDAAMQQLRDILRESGLDPQPVERTLAERARAAALDVTMADTLARALAPARQVRLPELSARLRELEALAALQGSLAELLDLPPR